MKKILLSICLILTISSVFGQVPANNTCANATNLGTLGAPGACGSGVVSGSITTIATTNVNATSENPYIFTSCTPNFGLSVWYQFTVPVNGFGVVISVANGGTTATDLRNPEIAVFQGSCTGLTTVGCVNGAAGAGNLTISNGLVVGQTYYIRISGADLTQQHTFNLSINAFRDCSDCLNGSNLTINPLPINGTYQPGQVVSFCYHINQYTQTAGNWLHGVQLAFGNGWDLPTLTTTAPNPLLSTAASYTPALCTGTSCGNWAYYSAGITATHGTASTADDTPFPAGFYFNGAYSSVNTGEGNGSGCSFCRSSADGNPGNNFGDGYAGITTVTPSASSWNFCWTIQVKAGVCNPGASLGVSVTTSGDGESGGWTNAGCAGDASVGLSALSACCPPNVAPTSSVTCNGGSNGVLTGTAVTGSAGTQEPYVFDWSGSSGTIATNTVLAGTTNSVGSLPAGTYTLTVTDKNSCSATSVFTVTQPSPLPVTANASNSVICNGSPTTLTGGGASTYTWTGGAINGAAFSPSTTASYTVTGTSVAGCTNTAVTSVTVNPVPTTTASTTGTLTCATTTVALTSTLPGMSYTWTPPAGGSVGSANSQSTTASGASGTYTLLVKSAAGCTYTTTTTVTQNTTVPTTTASTTGTLTCATTTVALNSTLTGMNYTWTAPAGGSVGSANTQSTTASGAAGTYTLKVVNPANGCSYTTTTAVTQNTAVPTTSASTTGTLTCSTLTVALTSTLSGMNYTWTAPAGGSVASANTQSTTASGAAGTYTLKVVNPANGCSYTTTTAVTQNTTVPTTIASTTGTLTCTTSTVALNSTLAGMNYTWTAPAGGSVASANTQSTSSSGAIGTYTIRVVNPANGCSYTTTTSVTQNTTTPTVTITPLTQSITCAIPTVTMTGSATPSTCTVVWTGGVSSGVNSYTATASSANIYTLTVTNPVNGCVNSATAQILPSAGVPSVSVSITNSISCTTLTAQVVATTTSSPVSYTWTGPGITAGASASTATVNAGGQYTVVVTNASACSVTLTVNVPANTSTITPILSVTAPGSITCTNTTLTINATPSSGVTYTWTGGGLTSGANVQNATINSGGVYTLAVTNTTNGCVGTASVNVSTNNALPTVTVSPATFTTTCTSPTVQLTASSTSSNITYSWTPNGGSLNSTTISNPIANGAGLYDVIVTNTITGCQSSATATVIADSGVPTVTVSASSLTITCTNTTVTSAITTNTTVTYTWNPVPQTGGANPVFNAQGSYTASIVAANGCSLTTVIDVDVDNVVPTITITPTQTLTCASPTAVISTTVNPTSGVSYTWTGTGVTGQNSSSVTVNQAGDYTVAITNAANGCTNTASAHIDADTNIPVASISATSSNSVITCLNPSVTLSVSATPAGTYSYTWSGGSTTSTQNTSTTGVYTATVLNTVSGCTTTAQFTVTDNVVPPNLSVTNYTIPCGAPSATIGATASNVTYTWTGTGTILSGSNSATPTIGGPGQYVVTITDNTSGCTNSGTVTVSQNTISTAISANPTSGTAPLSVDFTNTSTGGTNYTWDFGDNNNNTSNASTPSHTYNGVGVYVVTFTVSDASGSCSATATISIEVFVNSVIIIPNVFTPNGDNSNDFFTIKSTGISTLSCDIFNRWGQKMFTISSPGEAWDGKSGGGNDAPEGSYFFILKATGYDGKEYEEKGSVNLFR